MLRFKSISVAGPEPGAEHESAMKQRRKLSKPERSLFLVLWWQAQTPYAAVFDDEVAAFAAANVRTALVVEASGKDLKFEKVADYYRRDSEGNPMPAEWRNVSGPVAWPWMPRPKTATA